MVSRWDSSSSAWPQPAACRVSTGRAGQSAGGFRESPTSAAAPGWQAHAARWGRWAQPGAGANRGLRDPGKAESPRPGRLGHLSGSAPPQPGVIRAGSGPGDNRRQWGDASSAIFFISFSWSKQTARKVSETSRAHGPGPYCWDRLLHPSSRVTSTFCKSPRLLREIHSRLLKKDSGG